MRSSRLVARRGWALLFVLGMPVALATPSQPVQNTPIPSHPMAGPDAYCSTAREFTATLEFLRDRKDLSIPEGEARKLSTEVSKGCTGASFRFIRVVDLLVKAGLTGKDAAQEGLDFSQRTDQETATFVTVFLKAFPEEGLDLDLPAAIQMARSMTREFNGDILGVREDFERVIEFCLSQKGLDLPRPQCGGLAQRIARKGQTWSGGISEPFLRIFQFASAPTGANLPTGKALALAEDLIAGGPASAENFIQGYRYAVSEKGLAMSRVDALKFARNLALQFKASKTQ